MTNQEMTLEEALRLTEMLRREILPRLKLPLEHSEALRIVLAKARAFGPMLEALENMVGTEAAGAIAAGPLPDEARGNLRVTAKCVREAHAALALARKETT